MKKTNKIFTFSMIILVMTLAIVSVYAEDIYLSEFDKYISESEEFVEAKDNDSSELMAVAATGCDDRYYEYRGMDMDAVAEEKGWTVVGKYIYDASGEEIGRYDDGSNGQEPHFHLYSEPGVHYILA